MCGYVIAAPVGRSHPDRCREVPVLEGGPRSDTRAPRVRGGPGGLSTIYVLPLSTDLLPQVIESTHFPLSLFIFTVKYGKNKKGKWTFILVIFFFTLNFSTLQKLGITPSTYYQVSLAFSLIKCVSANWGHLATFKCPISL